MDRDLQTDLERGVTDVRWLALACVLLASVADAATCPNQGSCEGMLQTQVLGAFPLLKTSIDASCSTLTYAGFPHCAQFYWDPADPYPLVTYSVTDVAPGTAWVNAAKAPPHRVGVTPLAIVDGDLYDVTKQMACKVDEYGDTRGGTAPGWVMRCHVCMAEGGGANLVHRIYTKNSGTLPFADGWSDGDVSVCLTATPQMFIKDKIK